MFVTIVLRFFFLVVPLLGLIRCSLCYIRPRSDFFYLFIALLFFFWGPQRLFYWLFLLLFLGWFCFSACWLCYVVLICSSRSSFHFLWSFGGFFFLGILAFVRVCSCGRGYAFVLLGLFFKRFLFCISTSCWLVCFFACVAVCFSQRGMFSLRWCSLAQSQSLLFFLAWSHLLLFSLFFFVRPRGCFLGCFSLLLLMKHKYRGSIIILSINKSVEPNE